MMPGHDDGADQFVRHLKRAGVHGLAATARAPGRNSPRSPESVREPAFGSVMQAPVGSFFSKNVRRCKGLVGNARVRQTLVRASFCGGLEQIGQRSECAVFSASSATTRRPMFSWSLRCSSRWRTAAPTRQDYTRNTALLFGPRGLPFS